MVRSGEWKVWLRPGQLNPKIFQEKPLRAKNIESVPQTETGGQGE